MWQTDGGTKQSARRSDPNLTEDLQSSVSANAVLPIYAPSCIKLTTSGSNDKEEEI